MIVRLWRWYRDSGRWWGFQALINIGLVRRDADLSEWEAGHYKNFRWQWRFWRGPYYDAALKRGFTPPRWRDTAFWWRRWR